MTRPGGRRHVALLGALALGSGGCALQFGGGVAKAARGDAKATASVAAALNAARKSNGVVGVRFAGVVDEGIRIRSGALHGGYDFVVAPGWLTLEPGVDLGAGAPASRLFAGVGAYGGLSGSARFRPLPNSDRGPAFNVLFFTPELVFAPRAGWWMAPEGAGRGFDFEYGAELGLRLVFGSDLASAPQGRSPGDDDAPRRGAPRGFVRDAAGGADRGAASRGARAVARRDAPGAATTGGRAAGAGREGGGR